MFAQGVTFVSVDLCTQVFPASPEARSEQPQSSSFPRSLRPGDAVSLNSSISQSISILVSLYTLGPILYPFLSSRRIQPAKSCFNCPTCPRSKSPRF